MFVPVRQHFPHRAIPDIPAAVRAEMNAAGIASRLAPGSRVAIGVGSRGVSNIAVIVRAVVDYFRESGMRPFIFPAMGSHGAGTAAGQTAVLAHYGIAESTMDCPMASSFDVVSLGRTELGIEAFAGRDAWESDGLFVVSRVKWHTSFAGAIESGVSKMLAIGLGKLTGAQSVHMHARSLGMEPSIRSVAAHALATGKILGGLAVLEDAHHATGKVAALPAQGLIDREAALLAEVKIWMGRIPVPAVDVLIVDEMGKNISGTGMDLKVVNRGNMGQYNPWPDTPRVERIFVRSLSPLSYGNATGVGVADVVHDRLFHAIDQNAGRVNAQTSGSLALVRTPLHFPSDRECLDLVASTVGKADRADVTIAWIRNTLELGSLALSENLIEQTKGNEQLEIAGNPFEIEFDAEGNACL